MIIRKAKGTEKIKDFLGNEWTFDCLGCAIANREIEIPGGVIYDGRTVFLGAEPEVPISGIFNYIKQKARYFFFSIYKRRTF